MSGDMPSKGNTMPSTRSRGRAGWQVVASKEFADHLLSARFTALIAILGLAAAGAVFAASGAIRSVAPVATGISALFLKLYTVAEDPIPFALLTFIGFLGPLLGIMFGFDAVNGERSQGTLPRLLAQPIHRDEVINGKFVGGLSVISIMLFALTVLVAGIGMFRLGLVPQPTEIARLLVWVVVSIVYVGFWLALATLISVIVRRAATSAIVTVAIWLGLALFGSFVFRAIASFISGTPNTGAEELAAAKLELFLTQLSPITLYEQASTALLDPEVRSVGVLTFEQIDRAIVSNLTLSQSMLIVWPHVVALVAFTVICFAAAYISFMRQEVRA